MHQRPFNRFEIKFLAASCLDDARRKLNDPCQGRSWVGVTDNQRRNVLTERCLRHEVIRSLLW